MTTEKHQCCKDGSIPTTIGESEPLLQFGKWIVHKGYWVSDNGEMILMTDGSPSRQISDGYRVVFAVHLRDMCMAMEQDLNLRKT